MGWSSDCSSRYRTLKFNKIALNVEYRHEYTPSLNAHAFWKPKQKIKICPTAWNESSKIGIAFIECNKFPHTLIHFGVQMIAKGTFTQFFCKKAKKRHVTLTTEVFN